MYLDYIALGCLLLLLCECNPYPSAWRSRKSSIGGRPVDKRRALPWFRGLLFL